MEEGNKIGNRRRDRRRSGTERRKVKMSGMGKKEKKEKVMKRQ
jgi:hypothetical protein